MAIIDDNLLFAQEFEEDFTWSLLIERQAAADDSTPQEVLNLYANEIEFPTGDIILEEDESGIIGSFSSKIQIPDITATVFSDRALKTEDFLRIWSNAMYDSDGAYNSRNIRILTIYREDRKNGSLDTDTQRFPTSKIHRFKVLVTSAPQFIGTGEGGGVRTFPLTMKAIERL